jgi:hypothetical protein
MMEALRSGISYQQEHISDPLISLSISKIGDFVDRIYPFELEIKYTSETTRSASYLNRHVESDREGWFISFFGTFRS